MEEIRHPQLRQVLEKVSTVIVGKRDVIVKCLVAMVSRGHLLLEDVPGVGKTMLVRALAQTLALDFRRIQFTPDLLPSDITGVSVYNQQTAQFEFRPGPIMGHLVLADEVNRTSPRTQAALLEAMEEQKVTVDGTTYALPRPFFVFATQNPVEYEGTYPLPEAQLDRFMFKLRIGYPSFEQEVAMLSRWQNGNPAERLEPVLSAEELLRIQDEVQQVAVSDGIRRYIVQLVDETRKHPGVYLGVSPRGALALMRAAQGWAYLQGRDYLLPDDVKRLVFDALAHRLILQPEARMRGVQEKEVLKNIVQSVPVPV
ncbi:MAG: AAA family ATPase [Bacillaceae bacterium G1]|nr:AAA family ATPase [Bacillota bacterium]OJF18224.1 MAG: AAA family ATPase [Bacillaceae bacterium G1]